METSANRFCTILSRQSLQRSAWLIAFVLVRLAVSSSPAATVEVTLNFVQFSPQSVSIQPGDTVRWRWLGNMAHTVTSGDGPSDPNAGTLFGSPLRSGNYTFSHT